MCPHRTGRDLGTKSRCFLKVLKGACPVLGPSHSGISCHVAGALAPPQNAGLWDWAELQGGRCASGSHGGCRVQSCVGDRHMDPVPLGRLEG